VVAWGRKSRLHLVHSTAPSLIAHGRHRSNRPWRGPLPHRLHFGLTTSRWGPAEMDETTLSTDSVFRVFGRFFELPAAFLEVAAFDRRAAHAWRLASPWAHWASGRSQRPQRFAEGVTLEIRSHCSGPSRGPSSRTPACVSTLLGTAHTRTTHETELRLRFLGHRGRRNPRAASVVGDADCVVHVVRRVAGPSVALADGGPES
jgi:hypothetical protein